ncbi:MAG: STAS domain-containing protein [bacterium]
MDKEQITTAKADSRPDISVITLRGFIDLTTADEVASMLDTLIKAKRLNIVFDLSQSDYVSSSIWGIFLQKIKKIRELEGDLKLAQMKPDVREVYKVLELFRVIKSFVSLEEAFADF